jgi:RimJ/RimL family protein N-acetyltransferase
MRLDCVESNARLRTLYRSAGYREVGRHDFRGPWLSVTLFEKTLTEAPHQQ